MKFLRVIQFKCKRATQLSSRAALCVNSSTPQLSKSSLPPFGPRISLERTVFFFIVLYFLCSLRAPVFCTYILSGSLVSFCYLFFSVVPSLEYRHSLCPETGLVRATPDQKLASVPCAARTGLVPQHLIKTTG